MRKELIVIGRFDVSFHGKVFSGLMGNTVSDISGKTSCIHTPKEDDYFKRASLDHLVICTIIDSSGFGCSRANYQQIFETINFRSSACFSSKLSLVL